MARSLYLAVLVAALLTLSAWAFASVPRSSRTQTNVVSGERTLADDDAEGALFALTGLKPGHTEDRCITVTNHGPDAAAIRLSGTATGNGLDAYLHLIVDTGSGGHFGNCSGFAGDPVFDGSLGDFVGQHHDYDSGLVAVAPSENGTTTFRLRVALADVTAAQGRTVTANFKWEARSEDVAVVVPPPPPPAAPEPAPDPVPDPAPVEEEKRAGQDIPDSGSRDPEALQPAADTPTESPSPAAPGATNPAPVAPGAAAPAPAVPATPLTDIEAERDASKPSARPKKKPATIPSKPRKTPAAAQPSAPAAAKERPGLVGKITAAIADAIAKVVAPVVQRTAFPAILLIIGGLFLVIQNRIDRRDPKLARAPLHAQPDLPFLPPTSPGDERP